MTELVSTDVVWSGWNRMLRLRIRLPDGTEIDRTVEDHGEAASVLLFDPERRVARMIRGVRPGPLLHGLPALVLESPAGLLDEGEAPADAALRETEEEVGVRLRELIPLGAPFTTPGCSTERMHIFLAEYSPADRTGEGGGLADEHENLEVLEIPLAELAALADRGEISNMTLLALVQSLRLRRPELF
jgi:nudix-type nucleoside diphosphatase (YffH/AdpP family)